MCIIAFAVAAGAFERIARGAVGTHALQRQFREQLADLPDSKGGFQFVALTATLELMLGFATQFGENPFRETHDFVAYLFCALVMAFVAVFAFRAVVRVLPALAKGLFAWLGIAAPPVTDARYEPQTSRTPAGYKSWPPDLFNRPPPLAQYA